MLNILKSIIFGIVEGITEWLPISSTGHLYLFQAFMPLSGPKAFVSMYMVVIQLGAIMAVVVLYWKRLWPLRRIRTTKDSVGQIGWDHSILKMWLKVIIATIPAAVIGGPLDNFFEAHFYNPKSIAVMLILFGILFIIVENQNASRRARVYSIDDLTYRDIIIIGLFQLIAAMFPGTSRSGATIIGALMIGVSRTTAAEFTFFLAIPAMFGGSLLKLRHFHHFTGSQAAVLAVGMIVAFAVSVAAIKFLMNYIKTHDFKPFGWYRIALGIVVLAVGMLAH
jgi:undecaprenyl-diphosphatase